MMNTIVGGDTSVSFRVGQVTFADFLADLT